MDDVVVVERATLGLFVITTSGMYLIREPGVAVLGVLVFDWNGVDEAFGAVRRMDSASL